MGLFSKKDYVCEKCGKTFTKRINLNGNLCDECWNQEENEKRELENAVRGYVDYHNDVFFESYSADDMRRIIEHRNAILSKYQNPNGISRAELKNISDNYKKITDEQAAEALLRVSSSLMVTTIGAAYCENFFAPTDYDGTIVDAEDVFAVGYTSDFRFQDTSTEVILCVVFTNDPYVPVFPMVYFGKIGFFELTKSKKGRANVNELFEAICPNLTYPVGDIKQLKRQIKQEGIVRGNLDSKFVLEQISDVSLCSGLFDAKKMCGQLLMDSAAMLDGIGYIQDTEIKTILQMDRMFNRIYWEKQAKRLSR